MTNLTWKNTGSKTIQVMVIGGQGNNNPVQGNNRVVKKPSVTKKTVRGGNSGKLEYFLIILGILSLIGFGLHSRR